MALMVTLPFIYSRKSMEPTLSPRFIFESAFLLVYHLYFFGLRKESYVLKWPKWSKYAAVLFLVYTLWTVATFAVVINFQEALYEVSRNFLNLLLLFTVVHAVVSHQKESLLVFCRFVAGAALIHGYIGMDEFFEWSGNKFPGGASPHGLMANRNLFGSAQALVFPFVIYLLLHDKGFWKFFATVCAVFVVSSIFISQTRSAWLSSGLVMATVLVGVFVFLPEVRKRLPYFLASVVIGAGLIVGFVKVDESLSRPRKPERKVAQEAPTKAAPVDNTTQSDSSPEGDDAAKPKKLLNTNSESVNERLVVWQESIGIIKDNPILGVGQGNWKLAVPYYRIGGIRNDYGKIVRIRPHNIYVQILTESGIVGFVLHYSAWALVLIMAIRVLMQSKDTKVRLWMLMMIAGFLAFASDGMFSFPLERYEHTLFLYIMMGFVIGYYMLMSQDTDDSLVKKSNVSRLMLIPIVGLLAWNIFLGKERHRFEYHMNRAKVFQKRKQNDKILKEVMAGKSKYVTLDPNKDPLEIQSAMALKNLKRYDEAMEEALKALEYNPHSTRNLNTLGTVYTETKQYDKAIETYQKALYYAPYYEITLKNLALNYLYSKDYKQCLATLEKFDYEGDEYFEKVFRAATYHYNKQQEEAANTENNDKE